jgi:hypothetical protein
MPRIKSLLNGEVSNVRGDIARELIRMGVAEAIDPIEENKSERKGYVVVSTDGTVAPDLEPAYRLPKPGDYKAPKVVWSIDQVLSGGEDPTHTYVAIRRDLIRGFTDKKGGQVTDVSYCTFPPKFVHDRSAHDGTKFCSVFGVPVPADIIEQYSEIWKRSENKRAPHKVQFKAHPNAKSDIARIETAVSATAARGVIDGHLQLDKRYPVR